jgi:hypothetical protein
MLDVFLVGKMSGNNLLDKTYSEGWSLAPPSSFMMNKKETTQSE